MTAVKKYRAVIWKAGWVPASEPWRVCFEIPGTGAFENDLDLRRNTHAEAIQAACGTLRRLNAGATEDGGGVVDP